MNLRTWMAVFLLLGGAGTCFSQQVVVFENGRSLVVKSHRQSGPWTFLQVESGEIAVSTASILRIADEGAVAIQSEVAKQSAPSAPESAPEPERPDPEVVARRHQAQSEGAGPRAPVGSPETKVSSQAAMAQRQIGGGQPAQPGGLTLKDSIDEGPIAATRRQPGAVRKLGPSQAPGDKGSSP